MATPGEAPLPPSRVPWDTAYTVGQAELDDQHHELLTLCDRLADLCTPAGAAADTAAFDAAYRQLQARVREHLEAEAALLADRDAAALERLRDEFDEFEDLVADIVTTQHFDLLELQRFLSMWCLGHIAGTAAGLRALFAEAGPRG